jgi:hypothetical protein
MKWKRGGSQLARSNVASDRLGTFKQATINRKPGQLVTRCLSLSGWLLCGAPGVKGESAEAENGHTDKPRAGRAKPGTKPKASEPAGHSRRVLGVSWTDCFERKVSFFLLLGGG